MAYMGFGMNHSVSKQKPKKYFASLKENYGQMLERLNTKHRSLAGEKIERSTAKMLLFKEKMKEQRRKRKVKNYFLLGLSVVLAVVILLSLAQVLEFGFMKMELINLI